MDERQIEQMAGLLAQHAGETLDVERVTGRVLARLHATRSVRRVPLARWLAAAAGVALIAGAAYVTFGVGRVPSAPVATMTGEPQLSDLNAGELTEILDSLAWDIPVSLTPRGTLDDLDSEQLKQLLQLMEG